MATTATTARARAEHDLAFRTAQALSVGIANGTGYLQNTPRHLLRPTKPLEKCLDCGRYADLVAGVCPKCIAGEMCYYESLLASRVCGSCGKQNVDVQICCGEVWCAACVAVYADDISHVLSSTQIEEIEYTVVVEDGFLD